MESLRQLFKIGNGPSSSHTIAPKYASLRFEEKHPEAEGFRVTLYGSLALTGKGHLTDYIIEKTLTKPCKIVWKPQEKLPFHTNGMRFEAVYAGEITDSWEVYSIGGGELSEGTPNEFKPKVYAHSNMKSIMDYLEINGGTLWEYVIRQEGEDIFDYLKEVWSVMKKAIQSGLETDGTLPGGLNLRRKASSYKIKAKMQNKFSEDEIYLFAYALAVSEENASAGEVVTAPTCGSCGILPAILYLFYRRYEFSKKRILEALAIGGLFGNIVKTNASISGAEVGCQGEVGVACAMAAAAATHLLGGTMYQVEYAAASALEHHLGLTCDPIAGLVQIPCIERNAFGAQRAFSSALFAINSDGRHMVHFDNVVEVMQRTGHDIPSLYKETSLGGLASYGLQSQKDNHNDGL